MIPIFRENCDCMINEFHGQDYVKPDDVIIKEKNISGEVYIYAEPRKKGNWAFGGTILYTSNGIFPQYNMPVKLHDRNMNLEG